MSQTSCHVPGSIRSELLPKNSLNPHQLLKQKPGMSATASRAPRRSAAVPRESRPEACAGSDIRTRTPVPSNDSQHKATSTLASAAARRGELVTLRDNHCPDPASYHATAYRKHTWPNLDSRIPEKSSKLRWSTLIHCVLFPHPVDSQPMHRWSTHSRSTQTEFSSFAGDFVHGSAVSSSGSVSPWIFLSAKAQYEQGGG